MGLCGHVRVDELEEFERVEASKDLSPITLRLADAPGVERVRPHLSPRGRSVTVASGTDGSVSVWSPGAPA
jgi:hypothetical protein